MSDGGKAVAVSGLAYKDVAHPAAREVGKTVAGAVHLLLTPINFGIRTAQAALDDILEKVSHRLDQDGVPADRIQSPPTEIIAPVIRAFQYERQDPTIRDLYLNLLATAMHTDQATSAHPAFADVIGQLSPAEAKLVPKFASAEPRERMFPLARIVHTAGSRTWVLSPYSVDFNPFGDEMAPPVSLAAASIDNLVRVGLARINQGQSMDDF